MLGKATVCLYPAMYERTTRVTMTAPQTLLTAHAQRHNSTAVNGAEAGCVIKRLRMAPPSSELLSSSRILKFMSSGTIGMYNHVKGKRHITQASFS